jgi:serine/threonine protein phosphatase 1
MGIRLRELGKSTTRPASVPDRVIFCAIGDIHGRLDLLLAAIDELRAIAADALTRNFDFTAVFLGDYIDRGAKTREVIEKLIALEREAPGRYIFLKGNHEQLFLNVLDGLERPEAWLYYGGDETLASYGVPFFNPGEDVGALILKLKQAVPTAHFDFLRRAQLQVRCGDYVFVHAGLRPDMALDAQAERDMLWLRSEGDQEPLHGLTVVHGHTPTLAPVGGRWRIGIDTGAYASHNLTMLHLNGTKRTFFKIVKRPDDREATITEWDVLATDKVSAPRAASLGVPMTISRRLILAGLAALILLAAAGAILVKMSAAGFRDHALERDVAHSVGLNVPPFTGVGG